MSSPSSPHPPEPSSSSPDDYADPGTRAINLSDRPVAESLREIMASLPKLPREQPPPLRPPMPVFRNRHWSLAMVGMVHLLAAFVIAGNNVWDLASGSWQEMTKDPSKCARLFIQIPMTVIWPLIVGLGLVFARRWARRICLASFLEAVLWVGVTIVAIAINNFPDLTGNLSADDTTPAWKYVLLLAAVGGIFWLLHALLNHRNVQLTCEIAQSTADWTEDRSASEMLLFVLLITMSATWAELACFHAWPCWGAWRFDAIHWVWGAGAVLAAAAAKMVARGRVAGPWLAMALTLTVSSSIVLTALHQPVGAKAPSRAGVGWDGFSYVWDDWDFTLRGGLAFTVLTALVALSVSVAALHSSSRRRANSASGGKQ